LSACKVASTQPADWVIHEFARAALPDRRHRRRLTAFAPKPTAPIPQACRSLAEAKATYRFVENDAIIPAVIRESPHQATVPRVGAHPIILAVQDTPVLNYTTHPCTEGLGPLCHTRRTLGLLLHSTLAITPAGPPLGFLQNAVRARDRHARVPSRERRKLAHKESYKGIESLTAGQAVTPRCPDTMLVNITDREGDRYELFVQALRVPEAGRVELLVRARHDRQLAEGSATLWQQGACQPVAATLQVRVGRHGDHPRRLASLSLRFWAVQLKAPKRKAEPRQMETAQRLERALSIDLVVAWRILALCQAARELPDDPISDWLPAAQWQTLWCYVHQRTTVPKSSPPVRQVGRWIAQWGGFLGRKSDGEPGTTTLWRGLQPLEAMTKMWELCHSTKRKQKCG
jgi:hypothetical protein